MRIAELTRLGLSKLEATVYLETLKNGNSTAFAIAKSTGLPKTTVYDQLKSLVSQSLVYSYIKRGKKHFAVSEPEEFLEKNKRQLEVIEEILPELKSQYFSAKRDRPRVRTYDTKNGIEVVIKELIDEEKNELLVMGSISKEYELFAENKRLEKVIADRLKKRFKARHIVDDSPEARRVQAVDGEELRTTKIIEPKEPFTSLQYIWTNKVVIISPGSPVILTIIEDREVYKLQKNIFESLWKYHPEKPGTKKVIS